VVILTSLRSEITLSPIIGRARGAGQALDLPALVVPALSLVILLSLVVALILAGIGLAAGGESDTTRLARVMGIIGLALIPMSVIQVLSGTLRGLEKMRQAAFVRTLPYLVWLATYAGVFALVFGVVAGYGVFRYRFLIMPLRGAFMTSAQSRRNLRLLVVAGMPLALALVLERLRNQLSNYLVALWLGNIDAGAYKTSPWRNGSTSVSRGGCFCLRWRWSFPVSFTLRRCYRCMATATAWLQPRFDCCWWRSR